MIDTTPLSERKTTRERQEQEIRDLDDAIAGLRAEVAELREWKESAPLHILGAAARWALMNIPDGDPFIVQLRTAIAWLDSNEPVQQE
jgi:hypothetical protein